MDPAKPIKTWQTIDGTNFVTLYPNRKILVRVKGEGTLVFQGSETEFEELLAKVKRKLGISQ